MHFALVLGSIGYRTAVLVLVVVLLLEGLRVQSHLHSHKQLSE